MNKSLSVSCGLCGTSIHDDGKQPDIVKCRKGHAFHRKCLASTNDKISYACRENQCREQFVYRPKQLSDRNIRAVMDKVGISHFYDQWISQLTKDFNDIGFPIDREFISNVMITETDYLKMQCKEIAALFLAFLAVTLVYYLLPESK